MARYEARIRLPKGLRNTSVEAPTEWEARELIQAQFGIQLRDIYYVKRTQGISRSNASRTTDGDDGDSDRIPLLRLIKGIVGIGVWIAVGCLVLRTIT